MSVPDTIWNSWFNESTGLPVEPWVPVTGNAAFYTPDVYAQLMRAYQAAYYTMTGTYSTEFFGLFDLDATGMPTAGDILLPEEDTLWRENMFRATSYFMVLLWSKLNALVISTRKIEDTFFSWGEPGTRENPTILLVPYTFNLLATAENTDSWLTRLGVTQLWGVEPVNLMLRDKAQYAVQGLRNLFDKLQFLYQFEIPENSGSGNIVWTARYYRRDAPGTPIYDGSQSTLQCFKYKENGAVKTWTALTANVPTEPPDPFAIPFQSATSYFTNSWGGSIIDGTISRQIGTTVLIGPLGGGPTYKVTGYHAEKSVIPAYEPQPTWNTLQDSWVETTRSGGFTYTVASLYWQDMVLKAGAWSSSLYKVIVAGNKQFILRGSQQIVINALDFASTLHAGPAASTIDTTVTYTETPPVNPPEGYVGITSISDYGGPGGEDFTTPPTQAVVARLDNWGEQRPSYVLEIENYYDTQSMPITVHG